jgi:large subunit ribosomal protein L9
MKVVLQQDVKGQGKRGELVSVSDGYARNYLLPRKLAIEATADAMNAIKLRDKAKREHEDYERGRLTEVAEKLKTQPVKVSAKAGSSGRLFGSVTNAEVAEALKAQYGVDIDRHQIILPEPIKTFGTYELKAKLGYGINAALTVIVDS